MNTISKHSGIQVLSVTVTAISLKVKNVTLQFPVLKEILVMLIN